MSRTLPKQFNPLVTPEASPSHDELLSRRRLGQTNLQVKQSQVGTSNATKPENLGLIEYAHLRAPLPQDLRGSEVHKNHTKNSFQDTYFLMQRSKDGYVSATGMFKIAFPWAKEDEEKAERAFLKAKPAASQDEVAGNVWVSPDLALELAEEYKLTHWVHALLDPSDIVQSPSSSRKNIAPPPKFELHALEHPVLDVPIANRRSRRSASPSKMPSPTKKIATPRRPRQTKAMKEANAATASAANAALQDSLASAASEAANALISGPISTRKALPDLEEDAETQDITSEEPDEKVKVIVDSTVEKSGENETTHTNVTVEMPIGLPDLPVPEDTEAMIARAKEMVEEANKMQTEQQESGSAPKSSLKSKRKADEITVDDEDVPAIDGDLPLQPAKKAKVLETRLVREKVRNRAMVGITATLAIAAAIPYFF